MKLLSILLLLAASAFAQAEYVAIYEANLSGSASVVTVQAPSTGYARTVKFVGAYVYCSASCDVTLERAGSPATTTVLPTVAVSSAAPAAKTVAYRSSNVGTGSVLGKYTVSSGGTQLIDLSSVALFGYDTTQNVTIRTSSITGVARIAIQFKEDR